MRVKELALEWVYIIKEMELANKNCHVSIFLNIICSLVTHEKIKDIFLFTSVVKTLIFQLLSIFHKTRRIHLAPLMVG